MEAGAARPTLPPIGTAEYFERVHADDPDPFGLRSRWYERRKRKVAMAMLPRPRYRRAFEPGCSVGAVTLELAGRCDEVVAADLAPAALASAAAAITEARTKNVRLERARVPQWWPAGGFDLVVLGELLYYLEPSHVREVARLTAASLRPAGHLLAVHWRPPIERCRLTGDLVHAELRSTPGLRLLARYEEELFLVEVLERQPGRGLPEP